MAIGAARLFGIKLPSNFNSPYEAANNSDFWRRWHMTLTRFLRDCLYIELGGNRKGRVRCYVNLMTTMLLGDLWHGAGRCLAPSHLGLAVCGTGSRYGRGSGPRHYGLEPSLRIPLLPVLKRR